MCGQKYLKKGVSIMYRTELENDIAVLLPFQGLPAITISYYYEFVIFLTRPYYLGAQVRKTMCVTFLFIKAFWRYV